MQNILNPKNKKIILVCVFVLSAFLISYKYTSAPRVWVDEGVFTETARNLALKGSLSIQVSPEESYSMRSFLLSTGYPVILPIAIVFKFFGVGLFQARSIMILYMFLLCIVFYLYSQRRWGFYPGIVSVLLLLSFSPFYGNGRPVQGEVPGLFWFVFGVLFFLFFEEADYKSEKYAVLSALFFGLSSSVKPVFLLVNSLILFVSVIYLYIRNKNKKNILSFSLTYLLLIFIWLKVHFPTLLSIKNIVRDFVYFGGTHSSEISVYKTILNNLFRFFNESTPILFLFIFIVVFLGFLFRLKNKEDQNIHVSEIIIFSFIVLNWGGYLLGTGWYRYFFPANVLLYILFVPAINSISKNIKNVFFSKVFFFIPLLLIIFQFSHLLLFSDNSFLVKFDTNRDLKNSISSIDPSQKIVFYNTNDAVVFLPSENYYQYLNMGDFLVVGDKNVISKVDPDFILTDGSQNDNLGEKCYKKTNVSKYFLYEKLNSCKK